MSTRRRLLLAVTVAALASCDAIVGISGTHVTSGGSDASAGAGGTAGVDASADVDAAPDAVADAPTDHSVGPPPSHGLGCALWPGDQAVTVGCPSGEVITGFSTVLYGNPTGSCSGSEAGADGGDDFQPGACNAAGAKPALESLCDGLQSCTFVADSNLSAFTGDAGDPCPGTKKLVAVQVQCGTAPTPEAGSEAGAATLPTNPLLDFDATDFNKNTVGSALPGLVWNDSSPNHDNAIVPTGNGVASPTVGLDQNTGKGLVRFSGTNQYLEIKDPLSQDLSKGFAAFAVVAPLKHQNWQRIFDFSSGAPQDNIILTENPNYQGLDLTIYTGAQGSGAVAYDVFNTSQLQLFSVRAKPAPTVGSSLQKVTLYKGGAPIFEQFMPAPNNITRTTNLIGMSAWTTDPPFDGYMAQLVVYNRALSDAEMTSAHDALLSSWKLCTATDTQTDPANCGYCGHLCAPGQTCNAGVCEGSMFASCDELSLPDTGHYYALCQPGSSKVSWVQARNACQSLGGDLASIPDKLASNAAYGGVNGPMLVGLTNFGTSAFEWSNGDTSTFAPWGGDAGPPPQTTESCAEIVSSSDWEPVSCTTAQKVPWICELPPLDAAHKGSCRKFLEPTTKRSWDICEGKPESDLLRRAVCKSEGGTLLAVQNKTEATELGQLLLRYNGNLPTSAIDLTDGATPFDWTLHDGSSAFINWGAGEPSVGEEPRCAALSADGTMVAAPCDANPEPVICSLKNGTPPDQQVGNQPASVVFGTFVEPIFLQLQLQPNKDGGADYPHGSSIQAVLASSCTVPIPMSVELGVSPGAWQTCIPTSCGTAVPVTIPAPGIAGVFDVYANLFLDQACKSSVGLPAQLIARIAVTAQ